MRILLVDDDPEILKLVTQFLSLSTHHDVMAVSSAKEALEAIAGADIEFDCILSDIQMPSVDGIELVRMIRRTPGYDTVPIIMLTAMQDKDHLDQAFFSGASDYVSKPFDFPDLLKRLQEAQKLCVDKVRTRLSVPGAGDLRRMGDEPMGLVLSEAVTLPGVASALDYGEFENYVRQLLRRQLFQVLAIAVKIDKADRVYAGATTEEFRKLLGDAATATSQVILAKGGAMSYRGNGIFLCLPESTPKQDREALQTALNKRLGTVQSTTGQPVPKLVVGDPVLLGTGDASEAMDKLADAIGNVEIHALATSDMFEVHGRLMKQQRYNDEQRRLEQRAFESLLRDPETPPTDDAWAKRLFRRAQRGAQT